MQLPWRSLHQPPLPRIVRTPRRPSATLVLLTLCLLGVAAQWSLRRLDAPADPLLTDGALSTRSLAAGRWWAPLTHLFLSSVPPFLWALACLSLVLTGRSLEAVLGRRHLAGLFLLTGATGGLGQVGLDALLRRDAPVAGPMAPALGFLLALACLAPKAPLLPFAESWGLGRVKVLHGALGALTGTALFGTQAPAAGALVGGLTGCLYVHALGFVRRPELEAAIAPSPLVPISRASSASWSAGSEVDSAPVPAPTLLVAPLTEACPAQATPRFTEQEQRMTPREFIAAKVDPILEKISREGVGSLSAEERQLLDKAREKMS